MENRGSQRAGLAPLMRIFDNIFLFGVPNVAREDQEAAKGWAAAGYGLCQPLGARNLRGSVNKEQASPGP